MALASALSCAQASAADAAPKTPPSTSAEGAPQAIVADARRLAYEAFLEAQAAFERSDYAAAAAAFEEAARFAPHPATWLDAADSWARAGHPVRAAELCNRVLDDASANPQFRAAAARELARLAPQVATLELRTARTTGITVRLDDDAELHAPARRRVPPGPHTIAVVATATQAGRTWRLVAEAGRTHVLTVSPEAPSVEEPARDTSSPAGSRVPPIAWACFGGAAGSAALAGIFGAMTVGAKSGFDAAPTQASADEFYRDRLVTNVALGTAAVFVVTGLVLVLVAPSRGAGATP